MSRIIRGEDKENGAAAQDKVSDRVLNHYEYDAFGNTISCEERVANRFRYQSGSKADTKPYTNSRPSFRKGVVEEVWENAKGPDGLVILVILRDAFQYNEIVVLRQKCRTKFSDYGGEPYSIGISANGEL